MEPGAEVFWRFARGWGSLGRMYWVVLLAWEAVCGGGRGEGRGGEGFMWEENGKGEEMGKGEGTYSAARRVALWILDVRRGEL